MKSIIHLITTIERGGAENQLLILAKQQIRTGTKVEIIPLKGQIDLFNDFVEAGASVNLDLINNSPLIQVLKFRKYWGKSRKLVHAHLPRAELIAAASQSNNNDFLVSRHNSEKFFPKAPRALSHLLSRYVLRRAQICICISNAVRDFIISNGEVPDEAKLQVVHYGYKNEVQSSSMKQNFLNENPLFNIESFTYGTIARLVFQKDIETLLRAFAMNRLADSNDPDQLLIVGDGPLRENLEILASELGIAHSIFWVGRTDNVHDFLELMDVFILSSRYEGFGLVLLEALEHGLPIIAANNSAIPEVLGKEYNYLFDTGNEKILNEKMKRIRLDNFDFLNYAKSRLELFDVAEMNSHVEKIYSDASTFYTS